MGKNWSEQEDQILIDMVRTHGKQWGLIATKMENRTSSQVAARWEKCLDPKLTKGPFTSEEDKIIIDYVAKFGPQNWPGLSQLIQNRSPKQCRERWFNHLDPNVSSLPWTQKEDEMIFDMISKYGHKWSIIAKCIPGRTDNAIKNRWNSSISKRIIVDKSGMTILTPDLSKRQKSHHTMKKVRHQPASTHESDAPHSPLQQFNQQQPSQQTNNSQFINQQQFPTFQNQQQNSNQTQNGYLMQNYQFNNQISNQMPFNSQVPNQMLNPQMNNQMNPQMNNTMMNSMQYQMPNQMNNQMMNQMQNPAKQQQFFQMQNQQFSSLPQHVPSNSQTLFMSMVFQQQMQMLANHNNSGNTSLNIHNTENKMNPASKFSQVDPNQNPHKKQKKTMKSKKKKPDFPLPPIITNNANSLNQNQNENKKEIGSLQNLGTPTVNGNQKEMNIFGIPSPLFQGSYSMFSPMSPSFTFSPTTPSTLFSFGESGSITPIFSPSGHSNNANVFK
ncbi:hypothetical protein TRFO_33119 [Tritrichomonas foetus]|uniref:Myb-like DNA-binding domain containing protein n=1 Tax=Tritrichomonas foetus TaxID=1144522 RepID=A0A1J4JSM0_9EUKA|nr:hypothetical protein TRFO_33119 [Tritrichomonas foetus]|eukprot:OHT00245.1 hypothetical protein TRFO_33119 [Tritrichomonas foetus]